MLSTSLVAHCRTPLVALALAAALPAQLAFAQSCPGDIVANSVVNGADLGTLLSYWGPATADPYSLASDVDRDGIVNGADLGILLANWGFCPAFVSEITPNQGCLVGGTPITIEGAHFGTATAVTIGGEPATDIIVTTDKIFARTPRGAPGTASVAVTTAAGSTTAAQRFTYLPATVSLVTPNTGVAAGGTNLTISGTCLGLTTAVQIGGLPCANLTVVDDRTLYMVTPMGAPGAADILISGSDGTVIVPNGFSFLRVLVPSWATLVEDQPNQDVVLDPNHRTAIAATGFAWRVRDNNTQIEMLLVPPGSFEMGCSGSTCCGCGSDEQPKHTVTLTNAYYLSRFEISQADWRTQTGANPSFFRSASPEVPQEQVLNRPVERVSWNAAQAFTAATGMRLPTEAEWEYAYRAGTNTAYHGFAGQPSGTNSDALVSEIGWTSDNAGGQTRPVGQKLANGLGFHDMSGNVWEWVQDRYGPYSALAQSNPTGPANGSLRIFRGGSWNPAYGGARSSYRFASLPSTADASVGFRVARDP